jgi:hypothetical protein
MSLPFNVLSESQRLREQGIPENVTSVFFQKEPQWTYASIILQTGNEYKVYHINSMDSEAFNTWLMDEMAGNDKVPLLIKEAASSVTFSRIFVDKKASIDVYGGLLTFGDNNAYQIELNEELASKVLRNAKEFEVKIRPRAPRAATTTMPLEDLGRYRPS